ncbi:hypothetical protein ACNFH5_30265 [Pseudomonas sp. NY15435]|uniref:hypothetical protein n=1 Tax=Pseudomonas sp. NY15435 TaxID=3400358 RepID=UPI003A8776EE
MRKTSLISAMLACMGLSFLISSPSTFADEFDDAKKVLQQQKEIEELQKELAEARKDRVAAETETATTLSTAAAADRAAISASRKGAAEDDATAKYAEITALSTLLGDPKQIGVDGSISFASDAQNIMLQSRKGGIEVTRTAADKICKMLGANSEVKAAIGQSPKKLVVPISEARMGEIVAAKLRLARFNALFETAKQAIASVSPTPPGGRGPAGLNGFDFSKLHPYSGAISPGAIAAIQSAQFLASGIDTLGGMFRINRTFTMTTTAREDLFESRLAACSHVFSTYSLARQADRLRLEKLVNEFAGKMHTLQIFTMIVAKERKDFDALPKAKQVAAVNEGIKQREAVVARFNSLAYSDDALLQDLALHSMELAITNHPIMTYTLSIQDTQILKKRFLLSNKLTYQGTAEVVYQVTGTKGEILDGDALSYTSEAYDIASTRSVEPLSGK